jgi:diguanylate cyclase (GGDEF)-like protein
MTSAVNNGGRERAGLSWLGRLSGAVESKRVSAPLTAPRTPVATSRLLFLPLALLVVVAFVVALVVGCVLARQKDDWYLAQQHASVSGAIEEFRTVFSDFVMRRANGLALIAARGGVLSAAVAEPRLAPRGVSHYRHDQAYLVDADGKLAASFPPGETKVPPSIVHIIESFRLEEARRRRSAPAETDLLDPEAAPIATDFVVLNDRPVLAAVAAVRATSPNGLDVKDAPILAAIVGLDRHLVGVLERTSGVEGLRIATAAGPRQELQSLLDNGGRIVGWFSWDARRPMSQVVWRLAPFLAVVAAFFVGFAWFAIRQVGYATHELAESEAHAQKMAHEDLVTGLSNRRRMLEILDRALTERGHDQIVTLAFLNVDGFKEINDSLGHQGGDQLLASVAGRLQAAMPAGAKVGRFGGDEFVSVIETADLASGIAAANAAVHSLARPFWLSGQMVQVGATIGIAQAPRHGESRDDLMRRADLALRTAKREGRGRVVDFEPAMENEYRDRRFINRELRTALAEGGLDVHYQLIVAADGQRVAGVEALLRWKHATRGYIPPAVFVPIAEQSGLMGPLGEFVLRRALADAMRWPNVYIAVNLSPIQVRDQGLVDLVATVMRDTGIAPARVMLEVTEGVLIDNPEEAKERLEQLRALGVKIALDDFGSGFSSLSYLRRFPIDKLKIDKEFVKPLGNSANGGVIIQAITALGRALGLSVLAEGVETEEQRILLRLAGCNEMQGFLFAKPAPRMAIDRLLAEARAKVQAAPVPSPRSSSIVET